MAAAWQDLVNFLGPDWTRVVIVGSIIFGILFCIAIIYHSRKKKKRAVRLKEFGPQVPFHSLPNEDLISKFTDSTGLMRHGCGDDVSGCFFGMGAMNLMEGNMGSIDFVTYDYEYSEGGGGPGGIEQTFRGTAIFLQSDQLALPSFKCAGRKFNQERLQKQKKKQVLNNVQPVVVGMSVWDQWMNTGALVPGVIIAKNLFTK